jgi:hypothetical protein
MKSEQWREESEEIRVRATFAFQRPRCKGGPGEAVRKSGVFSAQTRAVRCSITLQKSLVGLNHLAFTSSGVKFK